MTDRPVPPSPRRLTTEVLVVGAGPTGLMAGAWCAHLGIPFLVVDAKSGPTRESRALALQSRSIEVYRQLGLAEEVLRRAEHATRISPGVGRRPLGTLRLDRVGHGITAFPGLNILEQSANEELLAGHLARLGHEVAWQHGFHSLDTANTAGTADTAPDTVPEGRLRVLLDSPTGPVEVSAGYVIAADGASSPVRHALGIPFEGSTNPFEFYVLDAAGVTGIREGITLRVSREHFMLAFPMGGDGRGGRRARLLGVLRTEDRRPAAGGGPGPTTPEGPTSAVDEPRARAGLSETFGIGYTEASWFSTYRVHHRVATAFRAGRVFLAGDAAHVHSPVGAQGMNTGLQDAQNLACTLADVLAGRSGPEALDRYEDERRPVALTLVRTVDRVFGAVTSTTPAARALRLGVLPALWPLAIRLLPRSPAGGRFFGYLSQTRIHYWMPGTQEERASRRWGRRGRVVGRRLPWVPDAGGHDAGPAGARAGAVPGTVPTGDNHEVLGPARWQVHAYGPAAAGPAQQLAERHRELAAEPGGPASGPGSGLPVHRFRAAPEAGLPDGTALLVRPDGFVAALESGG